LQHFIKNRAAEEGFCLAFFRALNFGVLEERNVGNNKLYSLPQRGKGDRLRWMRCQKQKNSSSVSLPAATLSRCGSVTTNSFYDKKPGNRLSTQMIARSFHTLIKIKRRE
jgi:hypothetical protein